MKFKQISVYFRFVIGICGLMIILVACNGNEKTKTTTDADSTATPTVDTVFLPLDTVIFKQSKAIRAALKNKDYTAFAAFFHPTVPVRFSPYSYIDTVSDLQFTGKSFLEAIQSQKQFTWGSFDGSGDPMKFSCKEYLEQYVYNADFLHPEKDTLNAFIGSGNSINNLKTIYPGLPFTESYFSGFNKKYEGMDWTALRLVFKQHAGSYYLVAVVHDQWTI